MEKGHLDLQPAKDIFDFLLFQTPTKEQSSVLRALQDFVRRDGEEDFFILCGAAGTGKTSVTSALVGYLNHIDVPYRIAAPTGRAARILGRKTRTVSSTIHSLIYSVKTDKSTGAVTWFRKENRNKDYTVYIVDEASMIKALPDRENDGLFRTEGTMLTDLIDFIRQGNPLSKVVFLGDRNQIPPFDEVESLALDPNHLRMHFAMTGEFHYLTEVKRVEDGSYIYKNASKLRQAIDGQGRIPEIEASRPGNMWRAARDFVEGFDPAAPDAKVSIARSHRQNRIFNEEVRRLLFGSTAKPVVKGDLLIVLQNWRRGTNVLYNGDHVLVEDVESERVRTVEGFHFVPIRIQATDVEGSLIVIDDMLMLEPLLSLDGRTDPLKEKALRNMRMRKNRIYLDSLDPQDDLYVGALRLGYGYSITCNKAQGGEWDSVYVNVFMISDKKWLYTAVTRAKKILSIY
jgi:exodeoxyribonuclease-5